jgi:hypothetical protein
MERIRAGEEIYPAALVDSLLAGANPVAAFRAYRGFSQAALARAQASTACSFTRSRRAKPSDRWRRCAGSRMPWGCRWMSWRRAEMRRASHPP